MEEIVALGRSMPHGCAVHRCLRTLAARDRPIAPLRAAVSLIPSTWIILERPMTLRSPWRGTTHWRPWATHCVPTCGASDGGRRLGGDEFAVLLPNTEPSPLPHGRTKSAKNLPAVVDVSRDTQFRVRPPPRVSLTSEQCWTTLIFALYEVKRTGECGRPPPPKHLFRRPPPATDTCLATRARQLSRASDQNLSADMPADPVLWGTLGVQLHQVPWR